MAAEIPAEALQLRSLVRTDQTLQLSVDMVPVPEPGANEVLIRIEAAPVNPSDLGLLLAGADMTAAALAGAPERPVVTAPIPDDANTVAFGLFLAGPGRIGLRDPELTRDGLALLAA